MMRADDTPSAHGAGSSPPALAPARVERYVIRATMDGAEMDTCDALDAVEPLRRYYEVEGVPVTVVRCVEHRPDDVFLPGEAREGAVEAMAKAMYDADRPSFLQCETWEEDTLRKDHTRDAYRHIARAALAALARPSGEEVGNG